jgi:hypothetical protein
VTECSISFQDLAARIGLHVLEKSGEWKMLMFTGFIAIRQYIQQKLERVE